MKSRKKGFTILESLTYVFLTTLILSEGISLFISIYKSYLDSCELTYKYNSIQNFYTNLNNIEKESNIKEIIRGENYLCFSKNDADKKEYDLNKTINLNDHKIAVTYSRNGSVLTANTMLNGVKNIRFQKKGKILYFIFIDDEGKEFISCI